MKIIMHDEFGNTATRKFPNETQIREAIDRSFNMAEQRNDFDTNNVCKIIIKPY